MQIVGVSLIAVGVIGLAVFAAHIAWQEFKTLRYISRLDRWREDLD